MVHCALTISARIRNDMNDSMESANYENIPMQYIEIFKIVKNENFQWKNFDIVLIFAQNIDCGYSLEPPRRGGSNMYPQSMF